MGSQWRSTPDYSTMRLQRRHVPGELVRSFSFPFRTQIRRNDQYLGIVIGACVLFVFIVLGVILTCVYIRISKAREEERLNKLWEVPFASLGKARSKIGSESSRYASLSLYTS